MTATRNVPADSWTSVARTVAESEAKILWRDRTAVMFIFVLPAVLAGILGPAVSGLSGSGAGGQSALGFAVMFSFMVVTYTGHAFFREHWYGTAARVALIAPNRIGYAVGKALPASALALAQLIVFGAIAATFLDLPVHGIGAVQMITTGVLLVASGAALGFVLFACTRTTATLSNLAYLVLVTFGALGGAIVVFDSLPRWSQVLGYATPHFWAMRAARESTFGDQQWSTVLQSDLALLAITGALFLFGARRFDYRNGKDVTR